jgi:hypothetical protein
MMMILALVYSGASAQSSKSKTGKKPGSAVPVKKPVVKKEPVILLVKIKSNTFRQQVGAFAVRARIEDKIEDELEADKNGEWISGDCGPYEVNMLFKVINVDQAVKAALKVISEESFEKTVLMGVRTSIENGRWNYKTIYPAGYKRTL